MAISAEILVHPTPSPATAGSHLSLSFSFIFFSGQSLALNKLDKVYVGVWYSVWINGIETGAHQSHVYLWKEKKHPIQEVCPIWGKLPYPNLTTRLFLAPFYQGIAAL